MERARYWAMVQVALANDFFTLCSENSGHPAAVFEGRTLDCYTNPTVLSFTPEGDNGYRLADGSRYGFLVCLKDHTVRRIEDLRDGGGLIHRDIRFDRLRE